jgi:CMP-N-acetylneuraminic acid synthetase
MKLISEMAKIKDRVKALLVKHPHLRDSDNRLIANIWNQDLLLMGLNKENITGNKFLVLYATNELTNAETIRRVRQKIQEENPDLRGTVNEARQKEGEEVRKTI